VVACVPDSPVFLVIVSNVVASSDHVTSSSFPKGLLMMHSLAIPVPPGCPIGSVRCHQHFWELTCVLCPLQYICTNHSLVSILPFPCLLCMLGAHFVCDWRSFGGSIAYGWWPAFLTALFFNSSGHRWQHSCKF
jgi:hypothetical protein